MELLAAIWNRLVAASRRFTWETPSGTPAGLLLRPLRVLLLAAGLFRVNRLGIHASGLAFYLLLSLVPLLAFLFLIFKLFKLPAMVRPFLLEFVTGGNAVLVERITEYIENTENMGLGSVGVVTLFIIGFLVLQRVKSTLNLVWRVENRPGYGSRLLEYLVVLIVAPVLLVATFTISTYLAGRRIGDVLLSWGGIERLPITLAGLSGLAIIVLLVLYAYRFLPDTRVRWLPALAGALAAGTLLRIVQNFYIQGMLDLSNYNLVYGALVFLPLLMVWFYLGWVIFLLGAQVCCVIQNYVLVLEQRGNPEGAGPGAPYAVLMVLLALLREFEQMGGAASTAAIHRRAGLPRGVVEDALRRLAAGELITPVAGMNDRYVPRENPERWTAGLVLHRLGMVPHFAEAPFIPDNPEVEALKATMQKANRGLTRPLDQLALVELARDTVPAQAARAAGGGEGAGRGTAKTAAKTAKKDKSAAD